MSTDLIPINPVEPFLRTERMPHIWCPGCGIGTTVNCFTRALIDSKVDLQNLAIVSGIGCTGRVQARERACPSRPVPARWHGRLPLTTSATPGQASRGANPVSPA